MSNNACINRYQVLDIYTIMLQNWFEFQIYCLVLQCTYLLIKILQCLQFPKLNTLEKSKLQQSFLNSMSKHPFWSPALSSPELSSCSRQACSSSYIYQHTPLLTGWIYFGANLYLSPIPTGKRVLAVWAEKTSRFERGNTVTFGGASFSTRKYFCLILWRMLCNLKCFLQGACSVRLINTRSRTRQNIWKEDEFL